MKKRRELDALVNGKSGNGRRKKKGQHELLRNDTDSSDVEEFAIPDKAVVRKRSSVGRFCSTCVAVTSFFLLTACIITIGGLVWVHIDLKREVDQLRSDLTRVEQSNNGNPKEFHDLHSNVKDLQFNQTVLKASVKYEKDTIAEIFKQLQSLNSTTLGLTNSVAAAQGIKKLPDTVAELQQELANIGSNVENLKISVAAVDEFRSSARTRMTYFEGNLTLIRNMNILLESINMTVASEISNLKADSAAQMAEIIKSNVTINDLSRQMLISTHGGSMDPSQIRAIVGEQLDHYNLTSRLNSFNKSLHDRIQQIWDAVKENSNLVSELKEEFDAFNATLRSAQSVKSAAAGIGLSTTMMPATPEPTPEPLAPVVPESRPTYNTEAGGRLPFEDTTDKNESTPNTEYSNKDTEVNTPTGEGNPTTGEENPQGSDNPTGEDYQTGKGKPVRRRGLPEDNANQKTIKESIIRALRRSNEQ